MRLTEFFFILSIILIGISFVLLNKSTEKENIVECYDEHNNVIIGSECMKITLSYERTAAYITIFAMLCIIMAFITIPRDY